MKIEFWGVQGSFPFVSAYPNCVQTACLSVDLDEAFLIFDAGTGLMNLDQAFASINKPIYFFMSHFHFDHIMGFPYFSQFLKENKDIYIVHPYPDKAKDVFSFLFQENLFPLSTSKLVSSPTFIPPSSLSFSSFSMDVISVNHPGEAFAYKLTHQNKSFVYCTDNELVPEKARDLSRFIHNTDLLVHDSHFFNKDKVLFKGWGHSFVKSVVPFCQEAAVKHLCLFHHFPQRSKEAFATLEAYIQQQPSSMSITIATDLLKISI